MNLKNPLKYLQKKNVLKNKYSFCIVMKAVIFFLSIIVLMGRCKSRVTEKQRLLASNFIGQSSLPTGF